MSVGEIRAALGVVFAAGLTVEHDLIVAQDFARGLPQTGFLHLVAKVVFGPASYEEHFWSRLRKRWSSECFWGKCCNPRCTLKNIFYQKLRSASVRPAVF